MASSRAMPGTENKALLAPALAAFSLSTMAFVVSHVSLEGVVAVFLLLGLFALLPKASASYKSKSNSTSLKATREPELQEEPELQDDPVRWSILPSSGELRANMPHAVESENDMASLKFLVMHRPTHDPSREASGRYPYSWHLAGRKRTWEVRVQLRFKQLPRGKISFGLQMRPTTGHTKSFATDKDDAATEEGEIENPAFIMPLWAVDQFHVAELGEEPALNANLEGVGLRRSDGTRSYIDAMNSAIDNLSTDKVYTFCFWGVAQFIDVINWELRGLWPGFRMDAQKLSGDPLVYVVAYDLLDHRTEKRHVESRKRYYFKVALWSALRPLMPDVMQEVSGASSKEAEREAPGGRGSTGKKMSRTSPMQRLTRYVRLICWSQ
eukprot:TRINITY_DN20725_c0_g1_i1.p1 TRINITY_DN20725_c0_g1~~TRINITY_DN20725_c0_g1_i1.p1  ORF type:complete len:390 (-),score=68.00 TRINITY_DN20725_c0_g1_i1:79-1224(-)